MPGSTAVALGLRGGHISETGPKVCTGVLAFLTAGLAIPYLFYPRYQMTSIFGYKGEVSALAVHCLSVIGAEAMAIIALLLYGLRTQSKAVREAMLVIYAIQMPFMIFAQVQRAFLTWEEAMLGPLPVNMVQIALAVGGVVMGRM